MLGRRSVVAVAALIGVCVAGWAFGRTSPPTPPRRGEGGLSAVGLVDSLAARDARPSPLPAASGSDRVVGARVAARASAPPPLVGEGPGERSDSSTPPAPDYIVHPYLVTPRDQPFHPAYQRAVQALTREVQAWYLQKAGVTFRLAPVRVVRAPEDYLTMRCGAAPAAECRADRQKLPNWPDAIEKAIGGWQPRSIAWVFAQGGGGWAGGVLYGDYVGYGLFGDWVLEPISGVAEPAAITCASATWQCKGGVPKGTTAHELGHAFGLHHPDGYPGKSIMRWHGDYPDTGFLPHEIMILHHSPFFVPHAFDAAAPWLDFEIADVAHWGETLKLTGRGLRAGDEVEFVDVKHAVRVRPALVSDHEGSVRVPAGMGPGFLRARRGRLIGNAVPINLYPPKAAS